MAWYQKSMDHARDQEMAQLRALAQERAAIALNRLGNDSKEAAKYMRTAIDLYKQWGAAAIAAHLESKWTELLKNYL